MLFNSFTFLFFLIIVLPIFYILPTKSTKNKFLLFSSYIFYGYWDWRFCSLIAISTIIDFFIGGKIYSCQDKLKRKSFLLISLFTNLGILGLFKYFNFFIDSFESLLSIFGQNYDFLHINIILPVGISFYTFQTLSYTLDIYKRKLKPTFNFIDFSLFVAFFPQLVAGPIERARDLLPQLSKKLKPNKKQLIHGATLMIMGLFRKVIIGDSSGKFVDHIFSNMENYFSFEVLCALILFSIQIYADFSGYSLIARGTAKMLGVEISINFKQPYLSKNITEFWRRWHISLSSWLRDYLYISLGGNRKGIPRMYVNLLITMLLGGLWHGASWNFVIWGGLHGLYLCIHKLIIKNKKSRSSLFSSNRLLVFFKIIFTNILILFTWLFFRSTSIEQTTLFFSKIINWQSTEYNFLFLTIILTYISVILILDLLERKTGTQSYLLRIKNFSISLGILSALLIVSLLYMFLSDPMPFIYFQF